MDEVELGVDGFSEGVPATTRKTKEAKTGTNSTCGGIGTNMY
jgi:hypothetical protein